MNNWSEINTYDSDTDNEFIIDEEEQVSYVPVQPGYDPLDYSVDPNTIIRLPRTRVYVPPPP